MNTLGIYTIYIGVTLCKSVSCNVPDVKEDTKLGCSRCSKVQDVNHLQFFQRSRCFSTVFSLLINYTYKRNKEFKFWFKTILFLLIPFLALQQPLALLGPKHIKDRSTKTLNHPRKSQQFHDVL